MPTTSGARISGLMKPRKPTPSSPKPAPGRLAIVQDFLNTAHIRKKREEIGSPAELERWLRHRELLVSDSPLTPEDHRRVIAAREALRSLAAANNGARFDPAAVEHLGRTLEGMRWQLRLDADATPGFVPDADGVDFALGKLLAEFQTAWIGEQWRRFKACGDPVCRAAFYDATGRARFCTPGCSSRVRATAFRRAAKYAGRS